MNFAGKFGSGSVWLVGTARCAVRARIAGATNVVKSAFCSSLPAALPPGTAQRAVPTKLTHYRKLDRRWSGRRAGVPMVKLGACFAAALFVLSVRAEQEQTASGNPYTGIVERNVFALVPIPTNSPEPPTPVDPPVKITVNGIMNIFGQLEVIFKAGVPARGKDPAHDQSYEMTEKERQDDIEVVKIDDKASIVTFNNHGIEQEIPLADAPNVTAPAGGPGNGGGGVPMPGGRSPGIGGSTPGSSPRRDAANAPGGRANNAADNSNGSVGTAGAPAKQIYDPPNQPSKSDVTEEEQVALRYMQAKSQNDPVADLLPLSSDKKEQAAALLDANSK
jgi:hypothetical protein